MSSSAWAPGQSMADSQEPSGLYTLTACSDLAWPCRGKVALLRHGGLLHVIGEQSNLSPQQLAGPDDATACLLAICLLSELHAMPVVCAVPAVLRPPVRHVPLMLHLGM